MLIAPPSPEGVLWSLLLLTEVNVTYVTYILLKLRDLYQLSLYLAIVSTQCYILNSETHSADASYSIQCTYCLCLVYL